MFTVGLVIASSGALALLAQATGGGADNTLPLIAQYGLLAPLLVALWFAYKREATRADRLEAEVQRLNQVAQEKTLPAMFQVAESLGDFTRTAAELQAQKEIDRRLREIEDRATKKGEGP